MQKALLEDRAAITLERGKDGRVFVAGASSQKDVYTFTKNDFQLRLKTITDERYWLDTGVFKNVLRYL